MPNLCAVNGCANEADVEVILYDVYSDGNIFFEQDFTCPYLCRKHILENETGAFSQIGALERGVTLEQVAKQYASGCRRMDMAISHSVDRPLEELNEIRQDTLAGAKIPPLRDNRGGPRYPYTNRHYAQGFTIYRPLH